MAAERLIQDRVLEVGSAGRHASGYWGLLFLIATEGALFAYLLFSYLYITLFAEARWPPDGNPELRIAAPNTAILVTSSFVLWWGERGIKRGERLRLLLSLLGTLILGGIFVGLQFKEWAGKPFEFNSHTYSSLFFTVTGFHLAHVLVGLVTLACLLLWSALGYFDERRHAAVSVGALYWHFVDVVWLFVFTTIYLTPYAGLANAQ